MGLSPTILRLWRDAVGGLCGFYLTFGLSQGLAIDHTTRRRRNRRRRAAAQAVAVAVAVAAAAAGGEYS